MKRIDLSPPGEKEKTASRPLTTPSHISFLLAGGGTGGHLIPGIALGEYLEQKVPGATVKRVTTGRKIDRDILDEHQLTPDTEINSPPWPGLRPGLVTFAPRFGYSLGRSLQVIRRSSPDAIIGVGGFGCVPLLLAGELLDIPTAVMDQNVLPGKAVRYLSRTVNRVYLQWSESKPHLPDSAHVRVTGNPLRHRIRTAPEKKEARHHLDIDPRKQVLLIMGGSRGARSINQWVIHSLPSIESFRKPLHILHLAGDRNIDAIRRTYRHHDVSYTLRAFAPDMEHYYAAADLVVSRAGGTTIAELTALGKPAILIPYPHATENHQVKNARAIQRAGGARMISDEDLDPVQFRTQVLELLRNSKRRNHMKNQMKSMHHPQSAREIVRDLFDLLQKD